MKRLWLSTAMLLCTMACLAGQAEQPLFTPQRGFAGTSHGEGTLRILFGKSRPFHVDSLGQMQSDGRFRLDQDVTFQGKPAKHRFWLIRETEPLHYTATLSDASGPVKGSTDGALLTLRYRVSKVLVMHQTLKLGPDGTTIDNAGRVTFLGIPIGTLRETIIRSGS